VYEHSSDLSGARSLKFGPAVPGKSNELNAVEFVQMHLCFDSVIMENSAISGTRS
jgi:hypothetical protein